MLRIETELKQFLLDNYLQINKFDFMYTHIEGYGHINIKWNEMTPFIVEFLQKHNFITSIDHKNNIYFIDTKYNGVYPILFKEVATEHNLLTQESFRKIVDYKMQKKYNPDNITIKNYSLSDGVYIEADEHSNCYNLTILYTVGSEISGNRKIDSIKQKAKPFEGAIDIIKSKKKKIQKLDKEIEIIINEFKIFLTSGDKSDNFTSQLFRLIVKADRDNLKLLKKAYPKHVETHLSYLHNGEEGLEELMSGYGENVLKIA